jgi:hypothetical protein
MSDGGARLIREALGAVRGIRRTVAMAEHKTFKMHEKLLLDVIMRQAGTVQKAVLEGVMNSIEAGATKVAIDIASRRVQITDNGKGFRNRDEIEKFFATFGQPHEESEGKKWAQFRMGRGQMFAFGRNKWVTGRFEMTVDIKARLGYDLVERGESEAEGCCIGIDLYDPLNDRDIYSVTREIERYVKFVSVPVTVNERQVNDPPEGRKWGKESGEDAWILLNDSGVRLEVYTLGVFVCDIPKYAHGVAGKIVSKKRLEVNFARNQVLSSCPVWKRIKASIERSDGVEKIKVKRVLSDDERANMIERLCSGELNGSDARKAKLFVDVTGHAWSANEISRSAFPCWSYAAKGDQRGDKLMQRHQAIVLDEEVVSLFDCKPAELFAKEWTFKSGPYLHSQAFTDGLAFRGFRDLAKNANTKHVIIPQEKWHRSELAWHRIIGMMQSTILRCSEASFRKVMIGSSDVANAWTDGLGYVAFGREFLGGLSWRKEGRPVVRSLDFVARVLAHELCHDGDSTTEVHSPEFYRAFHDMNVKSQAIANAVDWTCKWLSPKRMDLLDKQGAKLDDVDCAETEEPAVAALVVLKAPPKKAKKAKKAPPRSKAGRTAAEVTDAADIKAIWFAYKKNGGVLSYEGIEKDKSFGLHEAHGSTAYRVCKKYELAKR